MDLGAILAICAVTIAGVGFVYQQFAVLSHIKERLASLETKVELFWSAIESKIVTMLKSPTHLRKDELLDKLLNHSISMEEAIELSRIMSEETYGKRDGAKEIASCLMTGRLQQLIIDLEKKKGK